MNMAYNYGWTYKTLSDEDNSKYAGCVFTYANLSQAKLGEVNVTVTNNQIGSRTQVVAKSPSTNCIGVPRSGMELSWDDVLALSEDQNDPTPLFAIDYPYWENGVKHRHTLAVKAWRDAVMENRKIGSINPSVYGTYANIHCQFYTRIYYNQVGIEGEQFHDERIDSGANVLCLAYKPNTNDVTTFHTHLEFFYASEETGDWDDHMFQIFVGISGFGQAGSTGFCDYYLWSPKMWGATGTYESYFGAYNPNSVPYDGDYGYESGPDGYGDANPTHDFHSDDIIRSDNPTLSVLSSGFYNLYKVTSGFLANLGRAIFPPPIVDSESLVDALNSLCANQYNGKLIDYFIDCHIVPVDIPASGSGRIRAGGKELVNVDNGQYYAAPLVSNAYVSKSCGSVSIPEAFGNFLDYTVKCKLYLPCYGYVDIPAEYWNGGTISVEYCFNVIDGSFVAFVSGKAKHSGLNSLIGQYSGCAITHIPIRGADYSNIMSGLISVGIGTAATIATGHIASQNAFRSAMTSAQMNMIGKAAGSPEADIIAQRGALAAQTSSDSVNFSTAGSAASQLTSGLANVLSMKPTMVNNGTANASSSMMMHKKPYLIIEYPTPQFSSGYPKESGLPLNVYAPLGKYGGMTIAENPVLDGIPCTATEKARIRAALASGLIFR